MYVSGDISGPSIPTRKYRIGATLIAGQVAVWGGITGPSTIESPAGVESFANAIGVTYEAGTYATTAGQPSIFVKCSCSPTQIVKSIVSGDLTSNAAHTTACILTQAGVANMTTVIADANVATIDYGGGLIIGLTGGNAGHIRVLSTAQNDSTDVTVTVPFPVASVIGDTFFRTYNELVRGVELTTTYEQVTNLLAAGEALYTTNAGQFIVYDLFLDGNSLTQSDFVPVINPTNPAVEFEMIFHDHAFNRIS